jgi:hypothetical protein
MHAKTLHATSGGTFWYTVPDAPGGGDKLHAVQIPAEAKLAASKAKKSDPLVGRGMTVSITGEVGEAAKRQLVNRLTQAGINVADGAPIRLVTSITIKDHGRQEYTFKKSRQKQTVQVTSTTRRIAWERSDGKVLWESTSTLKTDDQFGTNLPEGKPLQELLDKPQLEARTKPFDTDEVPVPLLLDRNTTTVGWTRMASDGPQPGER